MALPAPLPLSFQIDTMRQSSVRLDTQSGGDGPGLAIASEIVEASGGRLELQNANPGLRATLVLVSV